MLLNRILWNDGHLRAWSIVLCPLHQRSSQASTTVTSSPHKPRSHIRMSCEFYLAENRAQIPEKCHMNLSDWGEGVNGEDELGGWRGGSVLFCGQLHLSNCAGPWGPLCGARPRGDRETKVRKRSRGEAEAECDSPENLFPCVLIRAINNFY